MPAYTTISCEFEKSANDRLVSSFYAAFLGENVVFDRVLAWGCDANLRFDEIVDWNQAKLDADFTIGFDQDVSHDYRQILVTVQPFSECRVFIMNTNASILFHCIVPEVEINIRNCRPFLDASLRAWSQLPVRAIESYGELDAPVGRNGIQSGIPPSALLFAVIDHDCTKYEYTRNFDLIRLDRGYLLTPKNA